jgi:hypothetical protein
MSKDQLVFGASVYHLLSSGVLNKMCRYQDSLPPRHDTQRQIILESVLNPIVASCIRSVKLHMTFKGAAGGVRLGRQAGACYTSLRHPDASAPVDGGPVRDASDREHAALC